MPEPTPAQLAALRLYAGYSDQTVKEVAEQLHYSFEGCHRLIKRARLAIEADGHDVSTKIRLHTFLRMQGYISPNPW